MDQVNKREQEKSKKRMIFVLFLTAACFYGGFIILTALKT